MSEEKRKKKKALTAEEIERLNRFAYFSDFNDVPEIPADIKESIDEVVYSYENYARKANLKEERIMVDAQMIYDAFLFAYKAHADQKRKTGEPYIIHPVATAEILLELEVDAETLQAALLHDTIEDTIVTKELVEKVFGSDVAYLVDGVTKLTQFEYPAKGDIQREEIQAENVRKMFMAMADDLRVVLIKLADRLHNMRTMKHQSPEKQIEKARETLDIYAPLAHRLGIYKMKWELEDLCLRYLDPNAYYELVGMIATKRSERERFMEEVVDELSKKLNEYGIKHAEIEGRPKHFYSIYNKMKTQDKSLEQIYDLFACRIIVETVTDCYTVLGIVHEMYQHIPGRFKDYIAMPKGNMYQSIHTTVIGKGGIPFEVQIRTFLMHRTAEYGIAAHWRYKDTGTSKPGNRPDDFDNKLTWIRQILDSQKDTRDATDFLDVLKKNLAPDDVCVFTPKGDVIMLPLGSCPIDFAYNIHSGIGNHMHGAKVNGRIVPLSYELKTGDIVEILSSDKITGPSRDWAKMVKTASARGKINAWFKKESREENIKSGKEMLEREVQRNGFTPLQLYTHKAFEAIFQKYSFTNLQDMYASIGYGVLSAQRIFGKLRDDYLMSLSETEREALGYKINVAGQLVYSPNEKIEDIGKNSIAKMPKTPSTQPVNTPVKKVSKNRFTKSSSGIIVDGLENCSVRISKCCHPLKGDEIVGYITQSGVVGVHKTSCPNILNIHRFSGRSDKDKERENRLIHTYWAEEPGSDHYYEVEIRIYASDRKHLLSNITDVIGMEDVFISKVTSQSNKDFTALIFLTIEVKDNSEYERVIGRIKGIRDVIEVGRT